jgi:hypothetical protein
VPRTSSARGASAICLVGRARAFQSRHRAGSDAAGGIKSLYSDSFFTRDEFAQAYGQAEYERLKARYDPQGRAPNLYEKCVRRA